MRDHHRLAWAVLVALAVRALFILAATVLDLSVAPGLILLANVTSSTLGGWLAVRVVTS